jgi:hypothetical protein
MCRCNAGAQSLPGSAEIYRTRLVAGSRIATTLDFVTTVPDNVGKTLYGAFNHDSQNLALALILSLARQQ